jgi:hypothetical protein
MSTIPKNIAAGQAALASPLESAQGLLYTIATMRAAIPSFAFQIPPGGRQSVANLANVPFEFMEQSNTAMKGESVLQRGGIEPDDLRKLFAYGSAHGPVADALEFLAKEMRESVDSAMSKSGNEALTTYQLAARYAKRPEYAHLKPLVQAMRRTLGRFRKSKAAVEQPPTPTPVPQPQSESELPIQ